MRKAADKDKQVKETKKKEPVVRTKSVPKEIKSPKAKKLKKAADVIMKDEEEVKKEEPIPLEKVMSTRSSGSNKIIKPIAKTEHIENIEGLKEILKQPVEKIQKQAAPVKEVPKEYTSLIEFDKMVISSLNP